MDGKKVDDVAKVSTENEGYKRYKDFVDLYTKVNRAKGTKEQVLRMGQAKWNVIKHDLTEIEHQMVLMKTAFSKQKNALDSFWLKLPKTKSDTSSISTNTRSTVTTPPQGNNNYLSGQAVQKH